MTKSAVNPESRDTVHKLLEELAGIGTPECQQWRRRIFARHPWFARAMAEEYKGHAIKHGYIAANLWLGDAERQLKLGRTGLFVDCQDSAITQYAEVKSKNLHRQIIELAHCYGPDRYQLTVQEIAKVVEVTGVCFPLDLSRNYDKRQAIAAMARICEPEWWRRQLRKMAARQLEQFCRALGMVSYRKAVYVSDYTLKRRAGQKHRNRRILEGLEAENIDTGYSASLADISDATVSNPVNRRNELMVRMRGYEECAKAAGFEGVFLTLTCPSAFHAIKHSGDRNPKYNGSTPREAQEYLCSQWAKIRAKWVREGIRCFGFRVVEPHHDGTPHWHLLLFFAPDFTKRATEIFKSYAMELDAHEPGAEKYRCDVTHIDPERGSATGYIAKYVSKNIDGWGMAGETDDECDEDILNTAQRAEAWASTWGIRQFQQIGSASVTVWRELRRLRKPLEHVSLVELEQIRAACDSGDWQRFVELMGGPLAARKDSTVRALHLVSEDEGQRENRYGEVCRRLMGVVLRGAANYITRIHKWRISLAEVDDVASQYEQRAFYQSRASGEPWSSVNNCTIR